MGKKGNCEYCEDCIYIGEGDFVCDKYYPKMLVKEDWTPTDYYCNCKACKECAFEDD